MELKKRYNLSKLKDENELTPEKVLKECGVKIQRIGFSAVIETSFSMISKPNRKVLKLKTKDKY